MSNPRKVYWDTSCFICFLNKDEVARSLICDDILRNADAGKIEIWISDWVIVEVIRPRRAGKEPLPQWAEKAIKAVPECKQPLEELWRRYQAGTPVKKLTKEQIEKIQGMFEWSFIKKIWVDEIVAQKAVELARDYNLRPADAVHAASAILKKCDAIQAWDKDYSAISALIPCQEPQRISGQMPLPGVITYGPTPDDFEEPKAAAVPVPEKPDEPKKSDPAQPPGLTKEPPIRSRIEKPEEKE